MKFSTEKSHSSDPFQSLRRKLRNLDGHIRRHQRHVRKPPRLFPLPKDAENSSELSPKLKCLETDKTLLVHEDIEHH